MYQLSNSGGYVTHPDCVFISVRLPPASCLSGPVSCAPAHALTAGQFKYRQSCLGAAQSNNYTTVSRDY